MSSAICSNVPVMARPTIFDQQEALEKAMQLFWRQGYKGTSINDLIRATGMHPGSIYGRFKSKKALFLAALDHYNAITLANIEHIFSTASSPLAAIRAFFSYLTTRVSNDTEGKGCLLINSAQELANSDVEIRDKIAKAYAEMNRLFHEQLLSAQQQHLLNEQQDTQSMAAFLLTCIWGINAISTTQMNNYALDEIVDTALRVLQ